MLSNLIFGNLYQEFETLFWESNTQSEFQGLSQTLLEKRSQILPKLRRRKTADFQRVPQRRQERKMKIVLTSCNFHSSDTVKCTCGRCEIDPSTSMSTLHVSLASDKTTHGATSPQKKYFLNVHAPFRAFA